AAVQRRFSCSRRVMVEPVPLFVRCNMHVDDESFAVDDSYVSIVQTYFSGTDRFNFRPFKHPPRLIRIFNEIVMGCFPVLCDNFARFLAHSHSPLTASSLLKKEYHYLFY